MTSKLAPIDLANAERPAGDRPPPEPVTWPRLPHDYWHGSAGGEVARLRARVLELEAEVARLRAKFGEPR